MEVPPPWLSPLRTAWAAAVTPWLMAWERFMRRAQAGGPSVVPDGTLSVALGLAGAAMEAPPVPDTDSAPAEKLVLRLSVARAAARRSG